MKPKLIIWLALGLSGGLSAGIANAQPVFMTYQSLELRVAGAQSIVRGTVSNCTGEFIERRDGYFGGYREDGTTRPNGVMRYTITVKVDEVLKGKPARTLELIQETMADDKRFTQWAEQHTSFMFFKTSAAAPWSSLRGIDSQSNVWNTIRLSAPVTGESTWSSDSPIYSMEFRHVTDPNELLARVRKLAENQAGSTQSHTFKTLWTTNSTRDPFASLAVPVNASLEKLARRMIQSPDEFMSQDLAWTPLNAEQRIAYQGGIQATRSRLQAEGISALQYFKSKENIELITPFLSSPAFQDYQETTGKRWRDFFVRKAAFTNLQEWNVEVPQPVIEEPLAAAAAPPELRFVSADSEETDAENGYGKNVVDGNARTYWHTQWQGANPEPPHEIIIELLPPSVINGFTYLPRQDESDHGTIKEYEFYVSDDGKSFGQPVRKGIFGPGKEIKTETFEPVKCRFIKLRAISEINGLAWTSAAEIGVIQNSEDSPANDNPTGAAGDSARLRAVLARLNDRVPELSGANPSGGRPDGDNSITANYATAGGSKLMIVAKYYDSAAAAKAGQEMDERMISVGVDKTEIILGVKLFEYSRYGALYFQLGRYTFRLSSMRHGDEDAQALLLKVSSALIAGLEPAVEGEPGADPK